MYRPDKVGGYRAMRAFVSLWYSATVLLVSRDIEARPYVMFQDIYSLEPKGI
jgi:hypothetical protein